MKVKLKSYHFVYKTHTGEYRNPIGDLVHRFQENINISVYDI